MLAKPYQEYVMAIINTAGAEIKAKGKYTKGSVKKNKVVAAAAAKSYAFTVQNAKKLPEVTAKFVNEETEKAVFDYYSKTYKALKKQGLVSLPQIPGTYAAAAAATPVALVAAKHLNRRDMLSGLSGVAGLAVFGGLMLSGSPASAGDAAYASAVAADLKGFLAGLAPAVANSVK